MAGPTVTAYARALDRGADYFRAIAQTVEIDFAQGLGSLDNIGNVSSSLIASLASSITGKTRDELIGRGLGHVSDNSRSLAARLQPRDARGRFVRDTNNLRRGVSRNLKNGRIGRAAKNLKNGMPIIGGIISGISYFRETGNAGRAISYGGLMTGAGFAAKGVMTLIGGAAVVKAAPLLVAVGVGLALAYGASWLYNNVPIVQNVVHAVGDGINAIGRGIRNVGRALNPFRRRNA